MDGKYIYGIITGSNEIRFDIPGLGGSSPVYTIAYQDLSCALSDYSGREFDSMPKEEVLRCLLRHQEVAEHAMREHTVLPVKFGTMLASGAEVRELLAQGYTQFLEALTRVRDEVEWEVVATWDLRQVLGEVGAELEIVQAREAFARRPGQATPQDRIQLGELVKASLDRRRERYSERMMSFLRPVAVDLQPNAMVSDQMVLNVAFLIRKAKQHEFDTRVQQLNHLFDDQIHFRVIGPLPPYSFATAEVTRVSPQKTEEARNLLHLGEAFSEPEVRKAYRHLAARAHPDRRPGDVAAKVQFARLRQASDLLIACCRGQVPSGGFLISVKRHRPTEVRHLRFAENGIRAGVANA